MGPRKDAMTLPNGDTTPDAGAGAPAGGTPPVNDNGGAGTPPATPPDAGAGAPGDGTTPPDDGQGGNGTTPPVDRLKALAEKKGWDVAKASDLLIDSYTQLESKLGNFKEIERRAAQAADFQKKAEMWDRAQRYLDTLGTDGKPDLTKMSVQDLAGLWRDGRIGLADVPAERQYAVQQFVSDGERVAQQASAAQATKLVEDNPWLKESPEMVELVATKIEQGVNPAEAVEIVHRVVLAAEKKAEERRKADVERLKNGNLERGGSPTPTKPNIQINSVADAFRAAKAELGTTE